MSPHLGYVIAAYGVSFAVIIGVIAWTILDFRAQSRALQRLEARLGRGDNPR